MAKEENNKINYTIACVSEFARAKALTLRQAMQYLYNHKALDFIDENYDAEHTLSFQDAVNDMTEICRQNGGLIA